LLAGQDDLKQGQAEIKLKIERTLTLMLGLANNEHKYPAFFFVVPVDAPSNPSLSDLLVAPDRLFNTELMIVFVCARSGRRVKYDGEDGLTFKVPKERVAKFLGTVSDFWKRFGPIIKLSAVFLSVALKATTGVSLSDLVPPGVASAISNAKDAASFASEYAEKIGEVVDAGLAAGGSIERSTVDSIKPADGVEGLDAYADHGELKRVSGTSYREFGEFLDSQGFTLTKLPMRPDTVDGSLQFVEDGSAPIAPAEVEVSAESDPKPKASSCCLVL